MEINKTLPKWRIRLNNDDPSTIKRGRSVENANTDMGV